MLSEHSKRLCGETIKLNDIASLPLILLRTVNGRGVYDQVLQVCEQYGLDLQVVCECHDSATLLSLVSSGFGATILPLTMIPVHMRSHVKTVIIEDNPFVMTPSHLEERQLPAEACQTVLELF